MQFIFLSIIFTASFLRIQRLMLILVEAFNPNAQMEMTSIIKIAMINFQPVSVLWKCMQIRWNMKAVRW